MDCRLFCPPIHSPFSILHPIHLVFFFFFFFSLVLLKAMSEAKQVAEQVAQLSVSDASPSPRTTYGMADRIYVADLDAAWESYVGKTVTIGGWVKTGKRVVLHGTTNSNKNKWQQSTAQQLACCPFCSITFYFIFYFLVCFSKACKSPLPPPVATSLLAPMLRGFCRAYCGKRVPVLPEGERRVRTPDGAVQAQGDGRR